MTIEFNNVVPKPLAGADLSSSAVWNSSFVLGEIGHYMVNATSGKGKSTFTNILAGLRHDYEGTVLFDNTDIRFLDLLTWARVRREQMAFVFQTLDLFPDLTVTENIEIKNTLTDFKSSADIKRHLEALEIDHLANQKAGNLSMGQQQRVAIVRSICQPFNWLVLDEPFSHLDGANIKKAWDLLAHEADQQKASTIITTLGNTDGIEPIKTLLL